MAAIFAPQGVSTQPIVLQNNDAVYVPTGSEILDSGAGDGAIYAGFASGMNYHVSIQIDGTVSADSGVDLGGLGEAISNPSNITIGSTGIAAGFTDGIDLNEAANVINYGQITSIGNYSSGLTMRDIGTVYNYGRIAGLDGIGTSYGSGNITINNAGSIVGTRYSINATSSFNLKIVNTGVLTGDVQLTGDSVFDSSLGQVYGGIYAGNGGGVVIAATNGGAVFGSTGNDVLQANRSTTAAGNHAQFTLDGKGGSNALYGGGAFNTFEAGDTNGGRNQIHGGLSLMGDVAGYANNTLDFSGTSIFNSVVVDLLNGHNAYVNSSAAGNGTNTLEDSIVNVPNVIGSSGRDVIHADNSGDTIQGGGGADLLYAGTGADTFVYKSYYDSYVDSSTAHYDTISGFATGKDKLDLSVVNSDSSHLLIASGSSSTTLYLEKTAGTFNSATDLAISFTGAHAIAASDVIF